MTSIELGDGRRLELEPSRDALRLIPAVAGAQLELQVRVITAGQPTAGQPAGSERFGLAAAVFVSRVAHQGRRLLCRVDVGHLVTPTARGADIRLTGFISAEQLRAVEELRVGGDLWLALAFTVSTVAANPPGPAGWTGELSFSVRSAEWATQLELVDAGAFVEVLVPVPDATDLAGAVQRLREARRLLQDNEIDAALGAARKALEPVLEAVRDGGLAKGAQAKSPRERDLPERFAVLVEATFSLLSGAAHDDEVTAGFRYSRAEAVALVATTAGLVKRLANQR
jgi:hypothetical protein